MFDENIERNAVIYKLWEKGLTVTEIAQETFIPRSTVGYYVRKFNKKARRGEPIIIHGPLEKLDSETLANNAMIKIFATQIIVERVRNEGPEAIRKYLETFKALKELEKILYLTKDESEAVLKLLRKEDNQFFQPVRGRTESGDIGEFLDSLKKRNLRASASMDEKYGRFISDLKGDERSRTQRQSTSTTS